MNIYLAATAAYALTGLLITGCLVPAFARESPKCSDPEVLKVALQNLVESRQLAMPFGEITLGLKISAPTTQAPTPANNGWYCVATGQYLPPDDPEEAKRFQTLGRMMPLDDLMKTSVPIFYKVLRHDTDSGFTVWASITRMPN